MPTTAGRETNTMGKGQLDSDKMRMSEGGAPIYRSNDGVGVALDAGADIHSHDGLLAISGGDISMPLDPSMWCQEFIDFNGFITIPDIDDTFVNQITPWVTESEAGTSPVKALLANGDNGVLNLALAANSEAADMTLYWGDVLNIPSNNGPIMVTKLMLPAVGIATDSRSWGFFGAKGTDVDPDANNNNAHFKVDGANMTLLVESDDDTTNDDDNDTGVTLVAGTYYEFMVSMSAIHGASATDVRFYYRSVLGDAWTRLLPRTTFAYGAGVSAQPFYNVEKSAGVGTPAIKVDYANIMWKRS